MGVEAYLHLEESGIPAGLEMLSVEAARLASVRLNLAGSGRDPALIAAASELRAACHRHGLPLVIAGALAPSCDFARAVGADGVQVADEPDALSQARKRLPKDAIVGLSSEAQRHPAMTAAEAGADYVAAAPQFEGEGVPDLVSWWSEMIEAPLVIEGAPPAALPALVPVADFIVLVPDTTEELTQLLDILKGQS